MEIWIIYPLLCCLIPVHILYRNNISETSLKQYFYTVIIFSLIIAFINTAVQVIFDNSFLSLLLTSLYFFMFFYGNYFFIMLFSSYKRSRVKYKVIYFTLYILSGGVLTYALSLLSQDMLIFIGKVLFYLSIFVTLINFIDISGKEKLKQNFIYEDDENNINSPNCSTPDFYHIITENVSKHTSENIISSHRNFFDKNGFKIYKNHKSNYDNCLLTIISMLNMEYCENISSDNIEDIKNSGSYYFINNLCKFLLKNSYKINFTYPSHVNCFPKLICEDIFYGKTCRQKNKIILSMLFSSLAYTIGAASFIKKLFNQELKAEKTIENFLELNNHNFKEKQPTFNFLHIKYPNKSSQNNNDNNNAPIHKLIHSIKKTMKPNSIIVLHDIASKIQDKNFSASCAIYIPAEHDFKIPENLSLVNFYRYILNYFFNTELSILNDEFITISPYTGNIKVITKKI